MRKMALEEIQQELLKMLTDFDSFCERHNLRYSLYAGTLLGAIRHQGFIPWDDDLDVCMPRNDYEKFLQLSEELDSQYSVITSDNSPFAYAFCKIQNKNIRAQEQAYEGMMDEYLWIDIFPVDGASSNEVIHNKKFLKTNRLIKKATWIQCRIPETDPLYKKIIKKIYQFMYSHTNHVNNLQRKVKELLLSHDYDTSEYVSCIAGGADAPWRVNKSDFEVIDYLKFEDISFPCMHCCYEYLEKVYGDYMQLPPIDKRQTHSINAWRIERDA